MESFPGQVNTATMTSLQTQTSKLIRFDPLYIRTLPGILKIAQLVSNAIYVINLENFL